MRTGSPEAAQVLGAAGVVYDQHDVDAIGLQQVHEEAPVPLRVQAHASRMLCGQSLVLAGRHLQQSLEDAVVLL